MTDDDWEGYDTGPFCRHYDDPGYCDEPCKNCGHPCHKHRYDDFPCDVEGCKCEAWQEA